MDQWWVWLGLITWAALGCVTAWAVGKQKGRAGLGLLLGLTLGFLGVLIIALLEPTDEERRRRAAVTGPARASAPARYGPAQTPAVPVVSRQEAVAESLRRDPSLGDTSNPDALKRLAESVAQVQEELDLKAQVATIRAAEEAQARRGEGSHFAAEWSARARAFQDAEQAREQAERVAAMQRKKPHVL